MTSTINRDIISFITNNNFLNTRLEENKNGSELCTFKVGGVVDLLIYPENNLVLKEILSYFFKQGISYKILGNGSNIVMPDKGLSEIIIKLPLNNTDLIDIEKISLAEESDQIELSLSSSSPLMSLSKKLSDLGLSGLEFASGIPGTLGGAVYMNAGAHGSEISEVVKSVNIINSNGDSFSYKKEEINFSYRSSNIKKGEIITEVSLVLKKDNIEKIKLYRKKCLDYRKNTQPLSFPSAGSVFKNPSKDIFAAKLIEDLGLKGTRKGSALISTLHANWIVTDRENGKSDDIKYLIDLIKDKVYKDCGIELKTEIIFW